MLEKIWFEKKRKKKKEKKKKEKKRRKTNFSDRTGQICLEFNKADEIAKGMESENQDVDLFSRAFQKSHCAAV